MTRVPERPDLLPVDAAQAQRAQTCAELGHPGSCYNPMQDKTWCACGVIMRDGNHFQHITCCGGSLDRWSK